MACRIEGDEVVVGENVRFGEGVKIRGKRIVIGDHATISDGVTVVAPDGFELGACSFLGPRVSILCWRFFAGSYLWMESDCEVGRGGHFGSPESVVTMGRGVFLGPGVVINPNCEVTIGDETGLGANVGIWTHGAYPPMTEGFPVKFAPVRIGSKVWLPGQTQVLPGVTIGDHSVVGMLSLVNKDIPAGSLAGGVPVKILKEGAFPAHVDLPLVVSGLVQEFERLAAWKDLKVTVTVEGPAVQVTSRTASTRFDFERMRVTGDMSDEAEDFRDFVRRRGIRFFTGRPFKPMPHPDVRRWR